MDVVDLFAIALMLFAILGMVVGCEKLGVRK
jgi:hypothetical protein